MNILVVSILIKSMIILNAPPSQIELKVGQKRTLSHKNYVFFEAANSNIVAVSRDPLSHQIRIEAKNPGKTFFVFQEVGVDSRVRIDAVVSEKVSKQKLKKESRSIQMCQRGAVLRFATDCRFVLLGW